MPPENSDPNKVWISREEYDRLRSMETQGQQYVPPAGSAPVYASPYPDHTASDKMAKQQKVVALILAIGLILSLSSGGLQWLAAIIAPIFIIVGIMSFFDYRKQRKLEETGVFNNYMPKAPPSVLRRVAIVVGIILLIPVIGYGAMFVFFIFLMTMGGGAGS